MDFQALINSMNEQTAKDRSNYHLTYGQLIEALKAAPKDATFDKRIKGIGSWRGSYIEIALFTDAPGYSVVYGLYKSEYEKESEEEADKLPTNANELGALLESLIGKDFTGWKGGNYEIEAYKPLWLEKTHGDCTSVAVIGIDKDLNLITKEVDADE